MTSAAGFTLLELLAALVIVLMVGAGVVRLADEAQTFALTQPEAADLTQRARVGIGLLVSELTIAGAGPSLGDAAGPLVRWFPPVLPWRAIGSADDPAGTAFDDRVTIISASPAASPLLPVRGAMATADAPIAIGWQAGCPTASASDLACGLRNDQRIAVFDRTATFELATVREAGPLLIQHAPASLSKPWREADDVRIAAVRAVTWYHDATRRQLRRVTGPRADAPVLDEVVGLSFRYFGDPAPPASPRPASGPGAVNCLFDVTGAPVLPALIPDDGAQIELSEAMLTDGPWCGSGSAQFDADLYRIRRVRVTLRLQATAAWARGPDPHLFAIPGTARNPHRLVPDFVSTVDITPRNLQP